MRLWIKACLFLSSYSPLFAIFLVRNLEFGSGQMLTSIGGRTPLFGWAMLLLAVVPNIAMVVFIKWANRYAGKSIEIRKGESRSGESLDYIVTYVIPFLAFAPTSLRDVLSMAILLFTLGIVYVNSDLIYTNPMLSLLGYTLYRLEGDFKSPVMLLSKRQGPFTDTRLRIVSLSNGVYLEVQR